MRNVFAKLTDVRPGEGQAVLKTVAILFCVIAGHTLTETARDTLFLGELPPERLAAVYGVLAVLATVASRFSTVLVLRFGRRSGLLLTLMVAAYGGSMFYLLPKSHTTVFSLYVFSGLISGVAIVQFWMLASHWFTVAQGRRLFGLISAGGVCGAMGGATLAICALEFFSVDLLLLIAVGLYLVAAGLVSTVRMSDEPAGAVGPTHVERGALSRAMSSMKQQPYVARLAILLAVSTSALLLTDYMFKSVAARTFAPSDLGGFFATYYAALNGLALLVQLVLSGVVVRRLGVVTAFLVLPLLLLAGGVSIIGFGGILAVVLVTKAADGGLRHSLHRVTSELLWMPLSDRVRAETKTFVDTVMVRAAQAVTAGALLLLARYGLDDPVTLAWGMCAPLVVWAVLGVRLRRPYLALFRSSLIARPDVKHQALDLDSVEFVIESLSDREPSKAIAAIDLLANNDRARLVPALILYHESPAVLCVGLRTITTSDRKDWVPLARRLLDHENVDVRLEAMRALTRIGRLDAAQQRLHDVRPEVRGHAGFLLEQKTPEADPRVHAAIREVLALEGDAGRQARCGLIAAAQAAADQRYAGLLLDLATDPCDGVAEGAVVAMTEIHDPRFVPILIQRLGRRRGRAIVRKALVRHGSVALEHLRELIEDGQAPARLRRHAPGALAHFQSQRAADILAGRLVTERMGLVRYKVLKALGSLATNRELKITGRPLEQLLSRELVEHLKMAIFAARLGQDETLPSQPNEADSLAMLLQLLGEKSSQALERSFRLLQILHRHEDIRSLVFSIRSRDRRVRASALEFIDALTSEFGLVQIRKLFGVIVDDLPLEEAAARVSAELGPIPSDGHATLSELLASEDETLATLAAYHVLERRVLALVGQVNELAQGGKAPLLGSDVPFPVDAGV